GSRLAHKRTTGLGCKIFNVAFQLHRGSRQLIMQEEGPRYLHEAPHTEYHYSHYFCGFNTDASHFVGRSSIWERLANCAYSRSRCRAARSRPSFCKSCWMTGFSLAVLGLPGPRRAAASGVAHSFFILSSIWAGRSQRKYPQAITTSTMTTITGIGLICVFRILSITASSSIM